MKHIKLWMSAAATAGLLALQSASAQTTNVISWNMDRWGFTQAPGNNGGLPVPNTTAGAPGYVAADWNSAWNEGVSGSASATVNNLWDSSGNNSGASITYSCPDLWQIQMSNPARDADGTYNKQMLNGYLDSGSAGGQCTVAISAIPYSSYSLIVYFSGDTAGRAARMNVGSTTYYFTVMGTAANSGTNAVFTQATSTTSNSPTANADYAIFSGLTGASQTLDYTASVAGAGGIAGFQVVSNSLPLEVWTGAASTSWDLSTTNWTVSGSPVAYADGLLARFDDSSTVTNVNLAANVAPAGVTVNTTNNYTIGSTGGFAISGGASLTKSGGGTLALANTNTYTGGTTVSAGTLQLGDGSANNGVVAGNISDNGNLAFANPADQTYAGVVGGSGTLTKSANGALTLTSANTYTGGTTVSGGTLILDNGGQVGCIQGALTINSGATVQLNTGDALGWGGGTAVTQINVNGGTLTNNIAGNNSYLASWTLTGGTMSSLAGGAYNIIGGSGTINTLASANPSAINADIDIRGGNSILSINVADGAAATDLLISGVIANSPYESGNNGITKAGAGTLVLSGANTYTGNTTVSAGTLLVNGSLASGSVTILGGTLLVNGSLGGAVNMGAGSYLGGTGIIGGATTVSNTAIVIPGINGTVGTLTFNSGLTLNSGATAHFDLSATYDGANDKIDASGGNLTLNGNAIHIKAPGSLVNLDTNADYVLITAYNIYGICASIPVWDVAPANSNNFSVVIDTSGYYSQVRLHYSTLTPPTGSGVATPSPAFHNQNVFISVTVTNGSGTVDASTGAVLNASSDVGSSSVPLVLSSTISSTIHVFTNTITVSPSALAGDYTLTAVITDNYNDVGTANISLAVNTTEVWNGGGSDQNWDTASNWVSGFAPDLTGDDLVFAGTVEPAPNMDNSYSVNSLTFSGNAGSFTIGSTTSSTLTLTGGGITNNSAYAQTLNVPVADAGGGLTKSGNGTIILAATNTYAGNTTINAGVLNVSGAGQLNAGAYAAAIVDNGTFAYSSSASQVLSGAISGTGGMTVNATNGGVLTLGLGATSQMTYTGPTIVDGGELQLNFANVGSSYGIAASSGLIINNGASVVLMNDNSLAGGSSAVGSVPVTINAGGVLTGSDTADGGVGASAHIRGLLTLNGGTLANGGTGAQPQWGTWNLDDGVVVNGGTNTSTMSALDIIPTQAGGTIFSVTNGGTTSGVDLDVTGTLINGTSMPDTGIILNGNGTMVLAGANTYAGPTIVSNGTLLVNGSTSTGAVTVEGGTLGGTGTIGGAVMVNSGGSLAPQNLGAGTLAINGNITLNVGSTSTFAVNGSTTANDAVAAGGTVAYGGVLNIVTNGSFSLGQTFTLFSGSGAASASSFSSIAGSPGSGLAFAFTNGVLSVVSAFTPSANNLLTCLAVNPSAGILSGFVSNTMTYSVTNYLPNNPVTVTVTNADPTATNTLFFNTVNEGALASTGATSGALTLTQGAANVLQVQVVSQSGATNTYTVNVTLQPNQSAFKLTNSVSGGNLLNLSWPADHTGYRLLTQTNNINKGVSALAGDWGPYGGGYGTTNGASISIIKGTNAFFRLTYP